MTRNFRFRHPFCNGTHRARMTASPVLLFAPRATSRRSCSLIDAVFAGEYIDATASKFLQLALQLLLLQCMTLTIDEILEHEERLRREIVERECLLAAFKVLHGYFANGQGPKSLELGPLVSVLALSPPAVALPERTAEL